MPLRVYNTLTRQKEPFQTVRPGQVGMYVCGPTVYKPSHVGHMVGPVIFDTVKRFLTYLGYKVTLLGDACATRAQTYAGETVPARQVHAAFLAALNGFYAKVITAREL